MFYDPVRLRTLATFSAADPWSGNRLTDYSIEEYVMMPLGSKRALDSKWSLHAIGIKWQTDARYRLLPECLVELWKCRRIPSEKLPSLLHAMEPGMLETDCIPPQSWQRSVGIPVLMMLPLCPAVFLLIRVDGQGMPVSAALALGLFLTLFTGMILWVVRSFGRGRVNEQMAWAIKQLSATPAPGPLPGIKGPFMDLFKLWLKLVAGIVALAVLALCGGLVYFKLAG